MTFLLLRELLEIWKERLGLAPWRINLILGGCEDEFVYMEIQHSLEYERANIHVNPWLVGEGEVPKEVLMRESLTNDFIESSLVHELLHLHTRNLRAIISRDLFGIINRDLHDQLQRAVERADEQAVDRLAEALVRAFREGSQHGPTG